MKKAFMGWSGGKDCTLALHKVIHEKELEVTCLLTNVSSETNRVSMHGVRRELITLQEQAIGIRGRKVYLPKNNTYELYNRYMENECKLMKLKGNEIGVFGDIFLQDLKKYREDQLAKVEMKGCFPLWNLGSKEVYRQFVELGYKAMIICVHSEKLGKEFLGKVLDLNLLNDFPAGVDCCGENGEFHTFCFSGPIYRNPVPFKNGETVYKTYPNPIEKGESGFYFLDLLPGL